MEKIHIVNSALRTQDRYRSPSDDGVKRRLQSTGGGSVFAP